MTKPNKQQYMIPHHIVMKVLAGKLWPKKGFTGYSIVFSKLKDGDKVNKKDLYYFIYEGETRDNKDEIIEYCIKELEKQRKNGTS